MNDEMTLSVSCIECNRHSYINIKKADYKKYIHSRMESKRMSIQEAFPYLSADEREMLISGICPKCWSEIWG